MFDRLKNFIGRAVRTIFPGQEIEDYLDVEIDISSVMEKAIRTWTNMYENKAEWIDNERVKTLNIPSSVAGEIARLVTIEMKSEILGIEGKETKRSEYLNEQYQRVVDSLRVQTEYAAAKGGMIFKPYVSGDKIAVDYVQADNFYPVKFNSSGELIAVIFPEVIIKDDKTYTRLEYHHLLEDNTYYTSNTAYMKHGTEELGGLGKEVSLGEVEEWADLEAELNTTNVTQPLFAYFKMPLANNKDSNSQLGVSVYGKAEELIKEADRQYSKILWEYEGTELAVDVNESMLLGGTKLPEGKDRLFRGLDSDDESMYKVYSPTIRDESLFNGLNKLLRRIEFNCGLAYGTLSEMEETAKTATEIKASKQRSYSTIVDIQKALRIALEHLIYAMEFLADTYNLTEKGDIVVSFDFDDSIIIDSKEEQSIMLAEVGANLIKPEYYLMTRYGISLEEAQEMLPEAIPDLYDNLE